MPGADRKDAGRPADDTEWPAPAKLNLCLRITGRRDDGYHRLQTAFQLIDLCDYLSFSELPDGQFSISGAVEAETPENDLCLQAARSLHQHCSPGRGVVISLRKNIPVGGGLGGGSSDAATTLLALNHRWRAGLDRQTLADIGLTLGADVPLFVLGHSAWGEDLGQCLTQVQWPQKWFVVVDPGIAVSTKEIFSAPELTRNSTPIRIRSFLEAGAGNDCEAVVRSRYPEVGRAMEWLGDYGEARLTGTGGCVFLAFARRDDAVACRDEVPGIWGRWLVKGLDASPVCDFLMTEIDG